MRIVSGKYRGRKLNSPKNNDVRPTSDMIKESVFNIIQNNIPNCRFLDLFAGSGAIGIEALSRGAKEVVFVDNNKESLAIVKSNLDLIGESAKIIYKDYSNALAELQGLAFDIIYIDPPFVFRDINAILTLIDKYNILSDTGIVVYESLYDSGEKEKAENFVLIKSKKYGTISIDIYSK